MDGQEPSPGWYVDPGGSGGLRWWDGAIWTGHVAQLAPVAAQVPLLGPDPRVVQSTEARRLPAPSDETHRLRSIDIVERLSLVDAAAREWMGLVAYLITGKTSEFFPGPNER